MEGEEAQASLRGAMTAASLIANTADRHLSDSRLTHSFLTSAQLPSEGEEAQASLRGATAAASLIAGHAAQLEGEASAAHQSIAALERLAARRRKAGDWAVQPTDTCLGVHISFLSFEGEMHQMQSRHEVS